VSTCPACRWENDADTGACAGCGRDLGGGAADVAAVPEPRPYVDDPAPRPYVDDAAPTAPPPAPEPDPPMVHRVAEPVLIRPQTRPVPRVVEPSRDGPRTVDLDRVPRPVEAGPRGPAAVREIPVVVAPSGSRAAVRFRDNAVSSDPGLPPAAPSPLPVGPGTRLCPSCGTPVESTRRFCRCGARLPATGVDRARAGAAVAEGWSTAAFRRAQRAANGGRRVRYDASLAARAYLLRTLLVALLIVLVASQAPPWGADVRHWVQTRVEQALPGQ
jgi:hypothetical protein